MQHNATKYFALARTEEMAGHDAPAILFYLASFCASLNCCDTQTLYRTTAKIQRLQARISLPDESLIAIVHSYGPLSDGSVSALSASISKWRVAGCPYLTRRKQWNY